MPTLSYAPLDTSKVELEITFNLTELETYGNQTHHTNTCPSTLPPVLL